MNQEKYPVMVTILCIAYNHEAYIRQCLDGFVMQKTNFIFEAVVHDDASTDCTADIIREYAKKYPGIIKPIIESENQYSKGNGIVSQIMKKHSHGKYIAICEGDDYWIDPMKLQKQVDVLESNPQVMYVFTGRYVNYENEGIIIQQTYKDRVYKTFDILSGFNPGLQTVCFRKCCLDALDKYTGINGDRLFPYYASVFGDLRCINDITSVYRVTGKGVYTQIAIKDKFVRSIKDFHNFHQILKADNTYAYCIGISKYLGFYFRNNACGFYDWRGLYQVMKNEIPSLNNHLFFKIVCCWIYNKIKSVLGFTDTHIERFSNEPT